MSNIAMNPSPGRLESQPAPASSLNQRTGAEPGGTDNVSRRAAGTLTGADSISVEPVGIGPDIYTRQSQNDAVLSATVAGFGPTGQSALPAPAPNATSDHRLRAAMHALSAPASADVSFDAKLETMSITEILVLMAQVSQDVTRAAQRQSQVDSQQHAQELTRSADAIKEAGMMRLIGSSIQAGSEMSSGLVAIGRSTKDIRTALSSSTETSGPMAEKRASKETSSVSEGTELVEMTTRDGQPGKLAGTPVNAANVGEANKLAGVEKAAAATSDAHYNTRTGAITSLLSAAGKASGSTLDFNAVSIDSERSRTDAQAARAQSAVSADNDTIDNFKRARDKTIDLLAATLAAQAEAQMAIARNT